MKLLRELIGVERGVNEVAGALRDAARTIAAPVVGALEVTCSDESELECGLAFQQQFVEHLLPDLKTAARAPFRTCNLGARYEWGSILVAERHFATPASHDAFKLMLVKLNSHVAVSGTTQAPQFGPMLRYETESVACGALHAMLRGDRLPALDELRQTFAAEGRDRIATLLDTQLVEPGTRYLRAAIASARLQGERAMSDIRAHRPHSPTLYVVVPCVTLNRPGPDTELVAGFWWADCRTDPPDIRYEGLGDDPARYRVDASGRRLRVTEP